MTMIEITPPPLSSQSMTDLLCTIIVICQGATHDGKPYWAYMCIKPSMAQAFREAQDRGHFNLEDFGTIVECGLGAEIPPDVQKRMERDYGVNHRYEDDLLHAIEIIKQEQPY